MRKEIVEEIVNDLNNTKHYKKIYKNIVPIWTNIPSFPAASVLYESEKRDLNSISGNRFYYEGTVLIYIFNKQSSSNNYDDMLSDYITEVYTLIKQNSYLKCNTIDCSIAEMKKDGGTVHPYMIAQIKVIIKYLQNN